MVRKNWPGVLLAIFVALCVGMGFLWQWNWDKKEYNKYPDRGLPRMEIDLNGVSLAEINEGSKEAKYEGNEVKLYEGGETLDYEDVEVKGRGNGTWVQEKKPYQIKFRNKVDLFGMGKARRWCLLANALDATNLRNEVALNIADMLGMEYTLDGEFVELYVDGEYEGLYYLTHAVEIDKQVVNLKNSLGVLVELDNMYGWGEEYYLTGNGDGLVAKDVVEDDVIDAAMGEFLRDYNEFEVVVTEGDFAKVGELVDVESFAKYYLLSEFTVNPDAYGTSFYMYKDGSEDKIHAGPAWDFDLALANRNWGNWMGEEFYSPMRTMVRRDELQPKEFYEEMGMEWEYEISQVMSQIVYGLMDMPEFQEEVRRVYNERLAGRYGELVMVLESGAAKIEEAARADEKRWGGSGFWKEVNRLADWIRARYEFFDKEYGYDIEKIKRYGYN